MATKRFGKNFSFGGVVAETDPLLSVAYWDNGDYRAISDPRDPHYFVIGRTGSGKSAAFRQLEINHPGKVIRIKPENLSLPYIANFNLLRKLHEMDVHLELFFKALWKHVIVVEVLRHRYKITSPEQKMHILEQLKEKLKRNHGKEKALLYLNEFGDKFWCDTDERVRQVTENFEKRVNAAASLGVENLGVSGNGSAGQEYKQSQESRTEVVERYQKIVNDTQLPRLNDMIVALNDEILDSEQHFTYLIIDDLDKEWVDEKMANILIKCLFESVVDMYSVRNLKIIVALRTNIFQQLNYGAQKRGGQEEKIRGLSIHITWDRDDLQSLLEHRAEAACEHYKLEPKTLEQMLPNVNKKTPNPVDHIIDRTLMRPRDVIQYFNACFREASNRNRLTWDDINAAEKSYSEERLLALRDEWKDPYEEINKMLNKFKGKECRLTKDQMSEILEEVALLLGDNNFKGIEWLSPIAGDIFLDNSGEMPWDHLYGGMIELLYRIGFLGITKSENGKAHYSYQEPGFVYRVPDINDSSIFEIHPAFRKGLEMIEYYYDKK